MYLPRNLLSHLYNHLLKTTHPLSPPVLILVSLDPDALCACRILTALLKRDYIPHKVQPVAGYSELSKAGQELVLPLTRQQGGDGGVVVCLGVGGLVDLEEALGLDQEDEEDVPATSHGVEVWVVDGRRPWNLQNVFGYGCPAEEPSVTNKRKGVEQGKLLNSYTPGQGGIVVFDDGDIEQELSAEAEAFCALQDMPELGAEDDDSEDSDDETQSQDRTMQTRKRKSSDADEEVEDSDLEDDGERPRQRRRSNSGSSVPATPRSPASRHDPFQYSNHPSSSQSGTEHQLQPTSPPSQQAPSSKALRKRLLKLRRKHESVLQAYYSLGTSYSEPISSMMYNLAEELGREDNDLLWLSIVGVSSLELYGQQSGSSPSRQRGDWSGNRQERIRQVLRDEVRRLNPIPASEITRERENNENGGVIPTTARSPTDTSIRISPEPRFLLTRHWSLYESMLHSPYLACRLHIWSEAGRRRLDRLLTKMGVSLDEARKGFTHMDMDLKRGLRQRLLKFAPMYGLDGLVPPADRGRGDKEGWGFVRCFGWKACLSAIDVAVIVSAILEIGADPIFDSQFSTSRSKDSNRVVVSNSYSHRVRSLPTPDSSPGQSGDEQTAIHNPDFTTHRFFAAYDALGASASSLVVLLKHVDTAKHLHRAILRTGSGLMYKHQIRHLRAFRFGVVKEGPDVPLFVHPGALVKLASWVAEAVGVMEAERGVKERGALVLGALDEQRGVYVIVGLGGGGVSNKIRSIAEVKAREEQKKKKAEAKEKQKADQARKKAERKRRAREREEANGIFRDEDDDGSDSDETEDEDSEDSDSDSDDEEVKEKRSKRGYGLNKFGAAFQEVVEETGARVRIDSFDHCVVEVNKDDFSGFVEGLSLKSVVG